MTSVIPVLQDILVWQDTSVHLGGEAGTTGTATSETVCASSACQESVCPPDWSLCDLRTSTCTLEGPFGQVELATSNATLLGPGDLSAAMNDLQQGTFPGKLYSLSPDLAFRVVAHSKNPPAHIVMDFRGDPAGLSASAGGPTAATGGQGFDFGVPKSGEPETGGLPGGDEGGFFLDETKVSGPPDEDSPFDFGVPTGPPGPVEGGIPGGDRRHFFTEAPSGMLPDEDVTVAAVTPSGSGHWFSPHGGGIHYTVGDDGSLLQDGVPIARLSTVRGAAGPRHWTDLHDGTDYWEDSDGNLDHESVDTTGERYVTDFAALAPTAMQSAATVPQSLAGVPVQVSINSAELGDPVDVAYHAQPPEDQALLDAFQTPQVVDRLRTLFGVNEPQALEIARGLLQVAEWVDAALPGGTITKDAVRLFLGGIRDQLAATGLYDEDELTERINDCADIVVLAFTTGTGKLIA